MFFSVGMQPAPTPDAPALPPPIPVGTPWGAWATIGFSILIALAGLFAQVVVMSVIAAAMMMAGGSVPDEEWFVENGMVLAFATIASAPVVIGFVILLAWLRKGICLADYLLLRRFSLRAAGRWSIALLVFIAFSDALTSLLGKPIVPPFMVVAWDTAGPALPFLWIAVIFAAPLLEEFLFRGFLFAGLQQSRLGTIGAAVITSATWAAIHLQYDWYGIVTIFFAGLFLAAARQKSGSLWFCVFLHSTMNVVAMVEATIYIQWFR